MAEWSTLIPRYLGIDYGTKRIGLAVSDAGGGIASPLRVLVRQGKLVDQAQAVIAAAEEYGADVLVLGLPLNMDGTVGKQALITRSFGTLLANLSGKTVMEWDERLSSRGADTYLLDFDLTHKKRKSRRDALAAQIILQGFLQAAASPMPDATDEVDDPELTD